MHNALYGRLQKAARAGEVVTYREVAALVGIDPRDPVQRNELSRLLREVSLREHEDGRPLLSAIAVSEDTRMPGHGFFRLERSLGLAGLENESTFYAEELQRVHEYWARAEPSS